MAADEQRGRVVGTVMTGLLTGILVARTVSGLVSRAVGWRPLFYAAAGLMIVVIVVVRAMLPTSPGPRIRYPEVLSSLVLLYRTHHHLRVRSAYGLLSFAAFSLFWTTLAFLLTGPRSRMTTRNGQIWSPRSMIRLRACWAVHPPSGWAVTPRTCTAGSSPQ